MVTGDQFGLAFGDVERGAAGFGDTCNQEAEERHRLGNDTPDVMFLPANDIGQVEGTREEQYAHHREAEAHFVTDGHGTRTQRTEEAVLGLGRPTGQYGAERGKRAETEQQEHAHVGIDDGTRDADHLAAPLEHHRAKPRDNAGAQEHDGKRDCRSHIVEHLVHTRGGEHFLEEQLGTVAHVLHVTEQADLAEVRNLDVRAVRALTVLHKARTTTFHRDKEKDIQHRHEAEGELRNRDEPFYPGFGFNNIHYASPPSRSLPVLLMASYVSPARTGAYSPACLKASAAASNLEPAM